MKNIIVIIFILSLLVGCNSNDNSTTEGLNSHQGQDNEANNTKSDMKENVDEGVQEDISVKSTITFPSKDGLMVTADTYIIDDHSDFIILFHQANWSRGEYIESALEFNTLGYNVMAVDLRSGDNIKEVENETAQRAIEGDYPNSGSDAGMDVQAAIEYVRDELNSDSMFILGSSYSGGLVLSVAPEYQDVLKGVLAFSPSISLMWNDQKVKENVKELTVPVFLTSSRSEKTYGEFIMPFIASEMKVQFVPETRGKHGARVLWSSVIDSPSYWEALINFLEQVNEQ